MPDIFVARGEGNYRGPDIVDPLLTTVQACLDRGRNELDEHAHGLQQMDLTVPFRPGLRMGHLSQVADVLTGQTWYGKIVGLSYAYGPADLFVTISMLKPTLIEL